MKGNNFLRSHIAFVLLEGAIGSLVRIVIHKECN